MRKEVKSNMTPTTFVSEVNLPMVEQTSRRRDGGCIDQSTFQVVKYLSCKLMAEVHLI